MFNRYFQQELDSLRETAGEYAKQHPALAPMLDGPSSDPDVERLLEGVAFLTGMVREKIDDEFPEIVHELIRHLWPHYLRPVPSATILQMAPVAALRQSTTVPAGVEVDSIPVDGTQCRFRTVYDMEIHPVAVTRVFFEDRAGQNPAICLRMELTANTLPYFEADRLRFYLGDDYDKASHLFLLLSTCLAGIRLSCGENTPGFRLSPGHLRPFGFSQDQGLIPYPSNTFPGFHLIQDYMTLPEKFMFVELSGLANWIDREEEAEFIIRFELDTLPGGPPALSEKSMMLHAAPAINLFAHDADPILVDHRRAEYRVRPTTDRLSHFQVFSVDKVTGFVSGATRERAWQPFHNFSTENTGGPVYNERLKTAPGQHRVDLFLSPSLPDQAPQQETLSMDITCTNGVLPESLGTGDIRVPTETTPEFIRASNLRRPTVSVMPAFNTNFLWQLLSLLSLNYVSISEKENLQALLSLFVLEGGRDKVRATANKKRIQGITRLEVRPAGRLVSGIMMQGREFRLRVLGDHFSGPGDLYLFGTMLSHFTAITASMNTFTRLVIHEELTGEYYRWPERIGNHALI